VWGDGGAYGAWVAHLERWGRDLGVGNAELPALRQDDLAPETWARLTNRIVDAMSGRLNLWATAFSSDLSRADSEFSAGRALTQARVGLTSVLALAGHPSLPEDLRRKLRETIEQKINSLQHQLAQELDRATQQGWDRSSIEARRRTLRENSLTAVLTSPAPPPSPGVPVAPAAPDPWASVAPDRPRRRLVVD
jgi:hypothetical protein